MKRAKEVYLHDLARQPFIDLLFFEFVNAQLALSFDEPISKNPLRWCFLDLLKTAALMIAHCMSVIDIFYIAYQLPRIRNDYARQDQKGVFFTNKWILREFTK